MARHLKVIFNSKVSSRKRRHRDGFALPNVLALSVVVMIFASSFLSALIPILQHTAQLKNGNTVRALAEASLDYVIGQMNNSLAQGQINSTWDPGTTPGATTTNSINAETQLGYTSPNATTPQITVTVQTLVNASTQLPAPGAPSSNYNYSKVYPTTQGYVPQFTYQSILYDPSPTSLNYPTNCTLIGGSQGSYANPYRQITVTVTLGATVKNLRVILQPIVSITTQNSLATNPSPPGFPYAVFGLFDFEFWGLAGSNTYNGPLIAAGVSESRLYADFGTLGAGNEVGSGSTTRAVVEGGYHLEFPANNTVDQNAIDYTLSEMAGLSVTAQAPWLQIMGNVFSNGDTEGYWPRGGNTASGSTPANTNINSYNNVFGLPDGLNPNAPTGISSTTTFPVSSSYTWSPTLTGWTGGTVTSYQNYTAPSIPAVPSAPLGTTSLGQVYLSGNQTMTIDPQYTTVQVDANGNWTLPPGSYTVSSLTMTSTSGGSPQIMINPSSTVQTQFYFQGGSGATQPISVDNNSQINMMWQGSYQITPNSGFNLNGQNGINNGSSPATPSGQLAINDPNNASLTNNIVESSGSASNLQIYYQGSQTINLQGNERMVVYAPNATVNVGGQPIANDANFYGAIVANIPRVISDLNTGGGAYFHYDYNLRPSAYKSISANGQPGFINPISGSNAPSPLSPAVAPYISGFRAVTWQEAVVPNSNPALALWY